MDGRTDGRTGRCACAHGYMGRCAYVRFLALSTDCASELPAHLALRPVKCRAGQRPLNPLAQHKDVLHLK